MELDALYSDSAFCGTEKGEASRKRRNEALEPDRCEWEPRPHVANVKSWV